jgi:DNA-binding NarL/FixJ family response regulator
MQNVFLADNHVLSSSGLKYILSHEKDLNIIEINSFAEFEKLNDEEKAGIFIIDYQYFEDPDLDYFKRLCLLPELKVMIISSDSNKERMGMVLEQEIFAFLTKECSKEEILTAVKTVKKGEKFFCHRIYDFLLESHKNPKPTNTILTQRESEILKLIVEGNSTQKIAEILFLSYHTINSHRKSICKKLKVKSPTELIIYALDSGILALK